MKDFFCQIVKNIYRLKIPFDCIYTSVFLVRTSKGYMLVDCATTDEDVNKWIIPALNQMGLKLKDIQFLLLTHKHGDHAGGLRQIFRLNKNIQVINEPNIVFDDIEILHMAGHTLDCIGVLELQSSTLIAGDGLQGAGVDKYRCSLESKEEYLKTIEKVKTDKRIKNIFFSHAYEPWEKDAIFGRKEIQKCLQDCINCIKGE
jgi:glyoxylase-like metal-dependent hydrolase (beta-lactamase superfamily II)